MNAQIDKTGILSPVNDHVIDSGKFLPIDCLTFNHHAIENLILASDQIL